MEQRGKLAVRKRGSQHGVLPRFLYSVAAIVLALLFVADPPLGDGLSDAAAYARQGLFARL